MAELKNKVYKIINGETHLLPLLPSDPISIITDGAAVDTQIRTIPYGSQVTSEPLLQIVADLLHNDNTINAEREGFNYLLADGVFESEQKFKIETVTPTIIRIYSGKLKASDQYVESIVEFSPTGGFSTITFPPVIKKNWYRRELIQVVFKRTTSQQLPLVERIAEPESKFITPKHTKHDKVYTENERSYPLYSILLKNTDGVTTIEDIKQVFDYTGIRSFVLFEDAEMFPDEYTTGLYNIRKFSNPTLCHLDNSMLPFEYAMNSHLMTLNLYDIDGPNYIVPGTLATIYETVKPESQIPVLNNFSRYTFPIRYDEPLKSELANKDIELRQVTVALGTYDSGSEHEGLEVHIHTADPYAMLNANNSYVTQLNLTSIATLSSQISATLEPGQSGLVVDLNLRNFTNTIDIQDQFVPGITLPSVLEDFIMVTDGDGEAQMAQISGFATTVGGTFLNTIIIYNMPAVSLSTNSEITMFKNSTAVLAGATLSIATIGLSTTEINDYKNQYPLWDDSYYKDHQHTGILMIPYSNTGSLYAPYTTIEEQINTPNKLLNTYYKINIPAKVRLKYNRQYFMRIRLLRKSSGSYSTNRPNLVVQEIDYELSSKYNGYYETLFRTNTGGLPGISNNITFLNIKDTYGNLTEYKDERNSHDKPKYYIFMPKDLSVDLTYPPNSFPIDNPEKYGLAYLDIINGKVLFPADEAPISENDALLITYSIENIINGYVNTESIIHYLNYNQPEERTVTLSNVLEAYDRNRYEPWNEYPLREYTYSVNIDSEFNGVDNSFTVSLGFSAVSKTNLICLLNGAILHPDDYYLGTPGNLLDKTKLTFQPDIITPYDSEIQNDVIVVKHLFGIKGDTGDAGVGMPWSADTSYSYGNISVYNDLLYRSLINDNRYNTPGRTLATDPPAFPAWSSIATYNLNDGILFESIAYLSLQSNNINNIPTIATTYWTSYIDTVYPTWSSIATYALDDLTKYGIVIYKSLINDNINNTPNLATSWTVYNIWELIDFNFVHAENNQNVGGIKVFNDFIEVPVTVPTKDTHVISKKYLFDILEEEVIDVEPILLQYTKHNRNLLGKQITTTWNPKPSSSNNNFAEIAWSDKLEMFIAIASSGTTNRSMISYDGIIWHDSLSSPSLATWNILDYEWNGISQSSDVETAIVGSSGRFAVTIDGFSWDIQETDVHNGNQWQAVCWASELNSFCAVAATTATNNFNVAIGTKVWSSDGLIATVFWTVQTQATYNLSAWQSVCWSPKLNMFVAVASSGTERIMYSSSTGEGLWTLVTAPEQNSWTSVCWSSELGIFAAVASNSNATNNLMISSDGANWTLGNIPSPPVSTQWTSITWAPELGMFCAVADLGTKRVATSKDGINWALNYAATTNAWKSITWSPKLGIFVAVSNTGNFNRIMTSLFPDDLV